MRKLPIVPISMPADLHGVKNGKLPPKLLTDILPSGKLHHLAAKAWQKLQFEAAKEGLVLVQIGDYRSASQQEHLFLLRMRTYPDARRTKQVTRTWNGKTWYLHDGAPVATPETSNHGWGLAVDCALRVDGRTVSIMTKPKGCPRRGLKFLRSVAPSLGWSWELQDEPWHIRYVAGDKLK